MTDEPVTFITYTKGDLQFVTVPGLETAFLNWFNSVDSSRDFHRETNNQVGVRCSPHTVKREATILTLVKPK